MYKGFTFILILLVYSSYICMNEYITHEDRESKIISTLNILTLGGFYWKSCRYIYLISFDSFIFYSFAFWCFFLFVLLTLRCSDSLQCILSLGQKKNRIPKVSTVFFFRRCCCHKNQLESSLFSLKISYFWWFLQKQLKE